MGGGVTGRGSASSRIHHGAKGAYFLNADIARSLPRVWRHFVDGADVPTGIEGSVVGGGVGISATGGTQFAVLRRSTEHLYGAPSSSPIQPICVSDDRRPAASSPFAHEPASAHSSLARRQICLHQPFHHGQHDSPTTSADGLKPISTAPSRPCSISPDPARLQQLSQASNSPPSNQIWPPKPKLGTTRQPSIARHQLHPQPRAEPIVSTIRRCPASMAHRSSHNPAI
ncbi:hypothetical protein ACLOJK_040732 [Asimina triloba]